MFSREDILPWSVAVTLGLVLIFIIQYKIKNFRRNRLIDKLPGPKPRFLIGNVLEVLGNREETAMGKNINAQYDVDSEYVQAVNMLTELLFKRGLMPWLYPDFVFNLTSYGRNHARCLKIVHDFTNQIIADRRKLLHEKQASSTSSLNSTDNKETEIFGKRRRLVFLDMLLESSIDGQGLSDADIREEVDTFVFEGHDTTAVALNWIIYNIGLYPEIQKRVHEELDNIFGDSDRFVTNEDLANLKFLDCVIKESLRLFPSVYMIVRQFQEDVNICGYTLPAGVDTSVVIYKMQHDPKHFPDPEKFIPDRFLAENAVKRHPYAYVPFSAGPRNCIGQKFAMMEEKVLISHILRKFKVTTTQTVKDYKMLAEIVLRPAGGTWIKIESRK